MKKIVKVFTSEEKPNLFLGELHGVRTRLEF